MSNEEKIKQLEAAAKNTSSLTEALKLKKQAEELKKENSKPGPAAWMSELSNLSKSIFS